MLFWWSSLASAWPVLIGLHSISTTTLSSRLLCTVVATSKPPKPLGIWCNTLDLQPSWMVFVCKILVILIFVDNILDGVLWMGVLLAGIICGGIGYLLGILILSLSSLIFRCSGGVYCRVIFDGVGWFRNWPYCWLFGDDSFDAGHWQWSRHHLRVLCRG